MLALLRGAVAIGGYVGSIAMWAITAVVAYDVTARSLGHPTLWALEVSSYLMIAVAILGAGDTLRHDGHFAVRVGVDMLPLRAQLWLDLLAAVACTIFVGLFAWGTIELFNYSFQYEIRSPTLLQVPLIYPQGLIVAGALLLALAFLLRIAELAAQLRRGGRKGF